MMLNSITRHAVTTTTTAFDFEAEFAKCETTESRLALLLKYGLKDGKTPEKWERIFVNDKKGRKYYGTSESRAVNIPLDKGTERLLRDFLSYSLPNW